MFKSVLGLARPTLGPLGPMGPHLNYRDERASARDEAERFKTTARSARMRATSGKFLVVGAITYVKMLLMA